MNQNLPLWLCITLVISACSTKEPPSEATDDTSAGFGVLIFGDSGYHLDYPDQDDFLEMFTADAYLESEYNDWLEDKRPMDEYEPRPSAISPVTGRVVPATGMDQVSAAMHQYCSDLASCDFAVMLGDNIYPSGATFGADGKDD